MLLLQLMQETKLKPTPILITEVNRDKFLHQWFMDLMGDHCLLHLIISCTEKRNHLG